MTQYRRWYSNKKIYDLANISRIDNFIIKLTREHIRSCPIVGNPLVDSLYVFDDNEMTNFIENGIPPPEAFTVLDKNNYIQNDNNVPVLYHVYRHAFLKSIHYPPVTGDLRNRPNIIYCTDLPKCDMTAKFKDTEKYAWLQWYQCTPPPIYPSFSSSCLVLFYILRFSSSFLLYIPQYLKCY